MPPTSRGTFKPSFLLSYRSSTWFIMLTVAMAVFTVSRALKQFFSQPFTCPYAISFLIHIGHLPLRGRRPRVPIFPYRTCTCRPSGCSALDLYPPGLLWIRDRCRCSSDRTLFIVISQSTHTPIPRACSTSPCYHSSVYWFKYHSPRSWSSLPRAFGSGPWNHGSRACCRYL